VTAVRVYEGPIAKKSMGNQRNDHNVENYIQWITTRYAVADNTGLSSFV